MADSSELQAQAQHFREDFQRLREAVGQIIVGQQRVVESVLTAIVAGGNVLLEGVPGLGKTELVKTLARALDLEFRRIQFTPDLMPADIVGTNVMSTGPDGRYAFEFRRGPIFTQLLLADEINRATPKTQSALLETMQEGSVTAGGTTHMLVQPFFVLATQNPLEMEGTYPLPEAQLDRFLFKLHVPFPTPAELHEIVTRTVQPDKAEVNAVLSGQDILDIGRFALGCPIAHHVVDYAVRLVSGSHGSLAPAKQYLRGGASPRAVQALILGSKLRALVHGRQNAAIDDIKALAKPVLRHRILLNFDAEADGVRTDTVVEQMLVEVDRATKA